MVSRKGIVALALAGTMVFGGAVSAMAASTGSPTSGTTVTDGKKADSASHNKNTVVANVENAKATVTKVKGDDNSAAAKNVTISFVKKNGVKVPVVAIAKNAFKNKTGKKITTVKLKAYKKATMTVKASAFNKSKANKIKIDAANGKIVVKKNAFKGNKAGKIKFVVTAKKAAKVSFKKGAFKGVSKKSVMKVKMSKKQFKKFKKAVKKAGFKGTIKRA